MTSTNSTDTTGVAVIRPGDAERSKQGFMNAGAISAESVGSGRLWMGMITIPPGARANAHFHADHDTAMYVLEGHAEMWYGDGLQHHLECSAGDFLYIPAGVPHVAANASDTDRCVAIAARTDPNEQESVVLTPELDESAR